jgi:hypothetical protein
MSHVALRQKAELALEKKCYQEALEHLENIGRTIGVDQNLTDKEFNKIIIQCLLSKAECLIGLNQTDAAKTIYSCMPYCKFSTEEQKKFAQSKLAEINN